MIPEPGIHARCGPLYIDLESIVREPLVLDVRLAPDWWTEEADERDAMLGFNGPLVAHLEISRAGKRYVLQGSMEGEVRLRCDRCLDEYGRTLSWRFRVILTVQPPVGDEKERELGEEEMSTDFVIGNTVDVREILKEQVFLAIPMTSLCRDDCQGLCPTCGANRNVETCSCASREKTSPFRHVNLLTKITP